MSQVIDDFEMMINISKDMGIQTLAEAFSQIERNYDMFFLIHEANDRLKSLEKYIEEHHDWGDLL